VSLRKPSPRIKDIASALDLSASTVSYALNDGPRQISAEVKERVWKKAEEMGYRRNLVAHALVSRRTRVIALVAPNMGDGFFHSPYNQAVATTLFEALEKESYDVRFIIRHDPDRYARISDAVLGRHCDAALVLDGVRYEAVLAMANAGLPLVCIGSDVHQEVAHYRADNRVGLQEALLYLYNLGHRKFGCIHGSEDQPDSKVRLDTFRSFVQEFDVEALPEWFQNGQCTLEVAAQCVHHIWAHKNRPTALVCGNDESAIGAMMALREIGVSIPSQVSVLGFDDVLLARVWQPKLTTVRQPIAEMVHLAARELILAAETGRIPDSRAFTTELVIRATTGPPPASSGTT
jgi:LacI family transcriptional regulator